MNFLSKIKKISLSLVLFISMTLLGLSSCGQDLSNTAYTTSDLKSAGDAVEVVVLKVRPVVIDTSTGNSRLLGTAIGGLIGGVSGSAIGQGTGSDIASVVGIGAGGVAGNLITKKLYTKKGFSYIVKVLSTGAIKTVTDTGKVPLAVGSKALLIESKTGRARIIRY